MLVWNTPSLVRSLIQACENECQPLKLICLLSHLHTLDRRWNWICVLWNKAWSVIGNLFLVITKPRWLAWTPCVGEVSQLWSFEKTQGHTSKTKRQDVFSVTDDIFSLNKHARIMKVFILLSFQHLECSKKTDLLQILYSVHLFRDLNERFRVFHVDYWRKFKSPTSSVHLRLTDSWLGGRDRGGKAEQLPPERKQSVSRTLASKWIWWLEGGREGGGGETASVLHV